jgi:hypothetical protein
MMEDDVQAILREIVQSKGYRLLGVAAAYRQIAYELNNLMVPQRQWGWQYLHQISKGKLKASHALTTAILRFQSKLDNLQPVNFETTQILAPPGFVAPGALILTTSRKCAWELCGREFVPHHPSQKYCALKCRIEAYKRKMAANNRRACDRKEPEVTNNREGSKRRIK